jgi:REP element-mobilizing transposase RayT
MNYDSTKHHRRAIRLPAYDYAQAGAYFVTVCTQNRECAFGEVVDGEMVLNEPGRMVETVWRELPQHYPGVEVDTLVVMPNHVHGIIMLVGAGPGPTSLPDVVGAGPRACPDPGQPQGVAPTGMMSLPDVVHRFKSLTTARYRRGVLQDRWLPFPGRLWQRNYYEHVIRNEEELDAIRQYIADNPLRWAEDRENPHNVGAGPRACPDRAPLQHSDGWTCPTP